MQLEAFINSLRDGARDSTLKAKARSILYKRDKTILALLKEHSPIDSGDFASNWKVSRIRFGSRGTLAGLKIINNTPKYGGFVAFGAEIGQAPWYFPHKKTGKANTGKLKVANGKVWAGGLTPGHDKTIGGPIVQVMKDYANKFSQELADEFVKDFL